MSNKYIVIFILTCNPFSYPQTPIAPQSRKITIYRKDVENIVKRFLRRNMVMELQPTKMDR